MANLNSFLDDAPESIRSNKEVIAWLSEKLETLESEKKIERLEAEIKKLKGSRSNEENLRKQANEWKAKYERLHRAATIPKHEHSEDNAKLIEKTRQQLLKQYDEEIGRRAENEQRQAQQVIEQAKKIERLQAENAKYRQVLEKAKKQGMLTFGKPPDKKANQIQISIPLHQVKRRRPVAMFTTTLLDIKQSR